MQAYTAERRHQKENTLAADYYFFQRKIGQLFARWGAFAAKKRQLSKIHTKVDRSTCLRMKRVYLAAFMRA
jgi:hypothetical protein